MRFLIPFLVAVSLAGGAKSTPLRADTVPVDQIFHLAEVQYKQMLLTHRDTSKFPQSLLKDGSVKDMPSSWWCSGFFGGSLWYIFEETKDPFWKVAADRWSRAVAVERFNTSTHDLGFMLYCSLGNGYRLTQDTAYKSVLLTGAKSLASRFDLKRGVIRSWDKWKGYDYPVIIDNMMNLEFLFWAGKQAANNNAYRSMAVTHADNTMKNHFRNDFSSYHVVCYGPNGEVLKRGTHQGLNDSSSWARGQAWALYGFTVMFRETKDAKYLTQARKIADYMLSHPRLPADMVPYWDFDAPGEERDASAAAVIASALLELAAYVPDSVKYFKSAEKILKSLSSDTYLAKPGENGNFILKHSVGSKPHHSEVDTPIIYADYYFLEALLRYKKVLQRLKGKKVKS